MQLLAGVEAISVCFFFLFPLPFAIHGGRLTKVSDSALEENGKLQQGFELKCRQGRRDPRGGWRKGRKGTAMRKNAKGAKKHSVLNKQARISSYRKVTYTPQTGER